MLSGMSLTLTGIVLIVLSKLYWLSICGMLLFTTGMILSFNLTYIFVTEMVVESRRQKYKVILAAMFSIGALYDVLLFYIIPDYKVVLMYFFGIPILGLIVVFGLFLKDTPISLITKQTPEEAYKSFMYIAKINKKVDVDLTLDDVK